MKELSNLLKVTPPTKDALSAYDKWKPLGIILIQVQGSTLKINSRSRIRNWLKLVTSTAYGSLSLGTPRGQKKDLFSPSVPSLPFLGWAPFPLHTSNGVSWTQRKIKLGNPDLWLEGIRAACAACRPEVGALWL